MLVSLRVKILKSDQYLISPCGITFELFIKIVRIKETITNQILLVSTKGNAKRGYGEYRYQC